MSACIGVVGRLFLGARCRINDDAASFGVGKESGQS